MASLASSENYLVLGSKAEVIVLYDYLNNSNKIVLPLPSPSKVNDKTDGENEESKVGEKKSGENCEDGDDRIILRISPSGRYVAACCGKKLVVWSADNWQVLSCRNVVRAASNIVFTRSESDVVLADKSGDVYTFPTASQDPGALLLGHLSVILDVLVSKDEKYIVTCDRDEKIRVSHFPNSYNIHCYCLGHKEFVTAVRFAPHDESILVSGSGDGTVKAWKYLDGLELTSFNLNDLTDVLPPRELPIAINRIETLKQNDSSIVCLSVSQTPKIIVLLLDSGRDQVKFEYLFVVNLPTEPICFSTCGNHLWVLCCESTTELLLFEWLDNKFTGKSNLIERLVKDLSVNLGRLTVQRKHDSLDYLYKKKYDNVQEYLVKKKARIEATS